MVDVSGKFMISSELPFYTASIHVIDSRIKHYQQIVCRCRRISGWQWGPTVVDPTVWEHMSTRKRSCFPKGSMLPVRPVGAAIAGHCRHAGRCRDARVRSGLGFGPGSDRTGPGVRSGSGSGSALCFG